MGAGPGTGGDPSVYAVVGIDIGGTGTRVVALQGEVVVASRTVATPPAFAAESASAFLAREVRSLTPDFTVTAVGIGASGPIDTAGVIRNPDTLPGFTGAPLLPDLREALGVPVSIDNDAACAAIAESRVGAARGFPSMLHVTLGTGIGAALIVGGSPFRGGDGWHPESGHIGVAMSTPACYCGREACWEQGASRRALQEQAARVLGRGSSDPTVLPELAERARRGDRDAADVFLSYGRAVADGLGTLLGVYRPAIAVIGGSASRYFDLYSEPIAACLRRLGGWIPDVQVRRTELDDYGGAIGAALAVSAE